ncbi:MAG: alpha-glucosidase [Treponema sp.]|jgi:alpha-glucosidase|nr:alpha-glucosidase [Treponema sp.]
MIHCKTLDGNLEIALNDILLIKSNKQRPFITLLRGAETVDMYRGNFFIQDKLRDSLPLTDYSVSDEYSGRDVGYRIRFSADMVCLYVTLYEINGRLQVNFDEIPADYNRIQLSFFAEDFEHVWGCGEQFSYFDLRGRHFPLWTQEQGVGRNKQTLLTRIEDEKERAGGDYYTTFYPQPTFISERGYYLHAETYSYADFDFTASDSHKLLFWTNPGTITINAGGSLLKTLQDLSAFLGRQRELPEWIYDGIILGIQDGISVCRTKLEKMQKAGCPVNGIWAQDWEGQKITSFGKRLKWNWQYDKTLYPDLPAFIHELAQKKIRFLGYINPYVLKGESLFKEADKKGLLVLSRKNNNPYLVDFGEFDCGIIDFTNPTARNWYADVICRNLIATGMGGWMADFGEYLPVDSDVRLFDETDPLTAHNAWPGYWAEVNETAIRKAEKAGECFFFMRAGNARSLKSCTMMWAGDQNVDWSEDDGLPSALTAALSLAMCGMGLHHSDIGGYTTIHHYLNRSKELLLRWVEFSAFTPLMRTHEGNIPEENWQFDSDEGTIKQFTRMTLIHVMLKPYLKEIVSVNHEKGIPVIRPVLLHYPCPPFFDMKDSYLLGRDLFVAPILHSGERGRKVFLPDDEWRHLFTGKDYSGGSWYVEAPIGTPPVFFRKNSETAQFFERVSDRITRMN